MGQSFPKTDRLLRREEFLAAQKRGRRLHSAHFVLVLHDRGDDAGARLGLVTSRKVGNAVRRNFIRRVVRETFRLHKPLFPLRHDVVVIARDAVGDLASATIRDEILAALARRDTRRKPTP